MKNAYGGCDCAVPDVIDLCRLLLVRCKQERTIDIIAESSIRVALLRTTISVVVGCLQKSNVKETSSNKNNDALGHCSTGHGNEYHKASGQTRGGPGDTGRLLQDGTLSETPKVWEWCIQGPSTSPSTPHQD